MPGKTEYSINLRNIPEPVWTKYQDLKNYVKERGANVEAIAGVLLGEAIDRFFEDPDLKKFF